MLSEMTVCDLNAPPPPPPVAGYEKRPVLKLCSVVGLTNS